ncbi:MAG: tetratricopeptide repeat protein [Phycisphaerae bacterium]|jgi:hypothetical protein
MKAEHRHELKTNELAQWLNNLPKWTKENMRIIIYLSIVLVLVVSAWIYKAYKSNVLSAREQLLLSSLLNEFEQNKVDILRQQTQGLDLSYMLIETSDKLRNFAAGTDNDEMAAFALIKAGQALRTELHYRISAVDNQTVSTQIAKAKSAYEEALNKAQNDASLRAMAMLGIGLCQEETANFDDAKKTYQQIVNDTALAVTTSAAAAEYRLAVMDGYTQLATFKEPPAPQPMFQPAEQDDTEIDFTLPPVVNSPVQE